ncbi:MAG: hypothetical protein LQ348_004696 [Seirophora lacunosa]|nr:MAG: hypothetical protein LQ348_004696 [Seirophora lacunosa]
MTDVRKSALPPQAPGNRGQRRMQGVAFGKSSGTIAYVKSEARQDQWWSILSILWDVNCLLTRG